MCSLITNILNSCQEGGEKYIYCFRFLTCVLYLDCIMSFMAFKTNSCHISSSYGVFQSFYCDAEQEMVSGYLWHGIKITGRWESWG